jgi:hypothetical protein
LIQTHLERDRHHGVASADTYNVLGMLRVEFGFST